MKSKFQFSSAYRPAAVPLVVHDPYFSIWSAADALTDNWSMHWTGTGNGLCGMLRLDDGELYSFSGAEPGIEKMRQTVLEVWPLRTVYQFEVAGKVALILTFLTPALPHKLEVLSRPATYLIFALRSLDGKKHQAKLYFDAGGDIAINSCADPVIWGRQNGAAFELLYFSAAEQRMLRTSGDNLRIEWGRVCMAVPHEFAAETTLNATQLSRRQFCNNGTLPADEMEMPRVDSKGWMGMSCVFPVEVDASGAVNERLLLLAYDDVRSIEFLEKKLAAYYRHDGTTFGQMLELALAEYAPLRSECERYDAEMMTQLEACGGAEYAQLCALAFRQAIGAHKLVGGGAKNDVPLFFSKENFSNGCIATVDVTYPSAPLFLLTQPKLLKGMLLPILEYAESAHWKFDFAPHDLGTYPLANGQVYGGAEDSEENQMPVEECGNLLILGAALLKYSQDVELVRRYWPLWKKWAEYLLDKGFDPENQLCTDDFAGHLAHNCNLSLKAILALGAFGKMAKAYGESGLAESFSAQSKALAAQWVAEAMPPDGGSGGKLAFDQEGSWSQKYNLVWDQLLDLNLFPASVAQREVACYLQKRTEFGFPLDSRKSYTKIDWEVWCACLAESRADFETLTNDIFHWCMKTPDRVPMGDWYETASRGEHIAFRARSVVGGLFLKLLYDTKSVECYQKKL